ncbi:hypothetical protein FGO68_gene4100 [Halteria grandinella]|uniref:Uncharacterized protein n=1 Tax=Halteria grandinella TaxID=5974 RepID=A0A8J8NYL2_HALGN|nr:hypothetical protein FGO68_gene4100 [Halteria grandinella]
MIDYAQVNTNGLGINFILQAKCDASPGLSVIGAFISVQNTQKAPIIGLQQRKILKSKPLFSQPRINMEACSSYERS